MERSTQGREALAEIDREFNAEGVFLRVHSRIHDRYWMMRELTPEEAAKREFSHHAADLARDAVMERPHFGGIDQVEEAKAIRDWLGKYIQKLEEAEARLYERAKD